LKKLAIDIAVPDMRRAGDAGRDDFGRVNGRTRDRRRRAGGDQTRAGDDAESHAQRTIDQLRKEADCDKQQNLQIDQSAAPYLPLGAIPRRQAATRGKSGARLRVTARKKGRPRPPSV
jgi:hypothetical protein